MGKRKILIGEEELDTPYNLRTTNFIMVKFMEEAIRKNESVNMLFNKALLPIAKKIELKSKKLVKR